MPHEKCSYFSMYYFSNLFRGGGRVDLTKSPFVIGLWTLICLEDQSFTWGASFMYPLWGCSPVWDHMNQDITSDQHRSTNMKSLQAAHHWPVFRRSQQQNKGKYSGVHVLNANSDSVASTLPWTSNRKLSHSSMTSATFSRNRQYVWSKLRGTYSQQCNFSCNKFIFWSMNLWHPLVHYFKTSTSLHTHN